MTQGGVEPTDEDAIYQRIAREFGSGQNIYVTNLIAFAKSVLVLLGEKGRVEYLREVGLELDRSSSKIPDRKAWAGLLQQI